MGNKIIKRDEKCPLLTEKTGEKLTDKSIKIDKSLGFISKYLKRITPDINKTNRLSGDKRKI